MANMSHCRFENTLLDLEDCYDAMDTTVEDDISADERKALVKLVDLCKEIANEHDHLSSEYMLEIE